MVVQTFVAADADGVVFQTPFAGVEGEGGVDALEKLGDGFFALGGGNGPEGRDGREAVAVDAQAQTHREGGACQNGFVEECDIV